MSLVRRGFTKLNRKLSQLLFRAFLGSSYGNGLICRLYFLIGSGIFEREQRTVLSGKRRYFRDLDTLNGNSALLRRNIHRLEKGLTMRPRRETFALSYIGETVDAYAKTMSTVGGDRAGPELVWAHAVLESYFELTANQDVVSGPRIRFSSAERPVRREDIHYSPYRRELSLESPVSYSALLALSRRRRSVRWFLQKPVPREVVVRAVELAAQAPSACNRQPFVFRVFDEPALVEQVASIPMGTTGYVHNIPAIVAIVGQQRNFFDERDRHLIYIDASLAVMAFALALETLGLASCLINWPDMEERERAMADLIGLESDERPIMLVAFGYPDPDGMVAASVKKPVEDLVRYNLK